jgi:hypothetical protein
VIRSGYFFGKIIDTADAMTGTSVGKGLKTWRTLRWSCLGLAALAAMLIPAAFSQSTQPMIVNVPIAIRPLPGSLDEALTFNSNSPEVVQTEGILLSTFPSMGMTVPTAHLNQSLQGRFDLFAHHIARPANPTDYRTLYIGIVVHNPSRQPVTLNILQAASYLSQPDAPFLPLPAQQDNDAGTIYAGPGDRAMNDVLRGKRQAGWPSQIILAPGQTQVLSNLPIPVKGLVPPLNGRSTMARLWASGPVYMASLSLFRADGQQPPSLADWQKLLQTSNVAGPRDRVPTPIGASGPVIYGRVAGVARGSRWRTQISDSGGDRLAIPQSGQAFGYGISTLVGGRLGTEQVQTAPLVVRYPDTAYQAHGNYAIEYDLTLPLHNPTNRPQTVVLSLDTPIKFDRPQPMVGFFNPLPNSVFFRGSVRVRYPDDTGTPVSRFIHLVQRRGQQGDPLAMLVLQPGQIRLTQVTLLYPPDATPPQLLTIRTLEN